MERSKAAAALLLGGFGGLAEAGRRASALLLLQEDPGDDDDAEDDGDSVSIFSEVSSRIRSSSSGSDASDADLGRAANQALFPKARDDQDRLVLLRR